MEEYLSVLDMGYFEASCAFEGLKDENVWRRPASGLMSVGEIAGHVAYWQAVQLAGENGDPLPDPSRCQVASPLIDRAYAVPSSAVLLPLAQQNLHMTTSQVWDELSRVHQQSVAYLRELNPNPMSQAPTWSPKHTYGWLVEYAAFHVAYHVGQIVTVRQLLGDPAPEN